MTDITDLLNHAASKNPVDFADTFNQLMMQKAQEAISNHRITLAQSVYGGEDQNETDDVEDEDFEFDEDDFDLEDLDDEEFDDIADEDLEDFDLEDDTDEQDA